MGSRSLEDLVEEVGSFHRFQLLLIPLTYIPTTLVVWSMAFMAFGAVEPDWWCLSRASPANQSQPFFLNYTVGRVHAENGSVSVLREGWSGGFLEVNGSRRVGSSAAEVCEALRKDARVCDRIVFAPGMTTMVTEFQLVCDLSWVPSLTISLEMAGVTIGSLIGGQLADSIGRKKTMVAFTVLHAGLNLLVSFSVSWHMFMTLRTLIGVTVGAVVVVGFSYPTEFIGVGRRAVVNSVPYWGLACVLFSLLVWAVPHWQHITLITATCSALSLSGWLYLPESVRWLVVKGHVRKAHRVLCKMARCNGRDCPSLGSVRVLCAESGGSQRKYTIVHIFSTRNMFKLSSLFGYMWFASSVAYYGILFGIKNLSGDFNLNFFLMTLVELPTQLLVFHTTKWFGRRWTIFGSFLIGTVSMITVVPLTLLLPEEEAGQYVNAMCMVCRGVVVLAWNALVLFNAEHYPTVVRNIGIGFCNMCGRMGGILAPYVLHVNEPYMFYSIVGAAMALTAIAPLFLAETRGRPLQDELFLPANQKAADTTHGKGPEVSKLSNERKNGLELSKLLEEQRNEPEVSERRDDLPKTNMEEDGNLTDEHRSKMEDGELTDEHMNKMDDGEQHINKMYDGELTREHMNKMEDGKLTHQHMNKMEGDKLTHQHMNKMEGDKLTHEHMNKMEDGNLTHEHMNKMEDGKLTHEHMNKTEDAILTNRYVNGLEMSKPSGSPAV